MRELLIRGFRYDRWANQVWLDNIRARGNPAEELGQIAHILASQSMWSQRIHGVSPTSLPVLEPNEVRLDEMSSIWLDYVTNWDLDQIVTFQRATGETGHFSIAPMAQHVINHGTYHRGVLRGLALRDGRTDFDDTDLSRYALLFGTD
jgi:uncharacterized damage-inducible protein DinB